MGDRGRGRDLSAIPSSNQAVAEFLERLADLGRTLHEQMATLAAAMVEAMRPFGAAIRQFAETHPEIQAGAREPDPGLCKCACFGLPGHECTGEATATLTLDGDLPGAAVILPVCDGCWRARLDAVVTGG